MEGLISDLTIVIVSAAILSFVAVLLKQPIIIAYIACGILFGPWGMKLVKNVEFINVISHVGITLLLFLAGLSLPPQKLVKLFKKTALLTIINCFFSFSIAYAFSRIFKFSSLDSIFIGLALMFSSTILTVKLIPTTTLHQQRMGAVCISILIIQDLLAVSVLAFTRSFNTGNAFISDSLFLFLKLIILLIVLVLFDKFILNRIMHRVERYHEMLCILGLAWCLGVATISNKLGLFYETGAFFAGVVLARHRISLFMSEKLKPIRDFFLVLFFFSLGANLDLLIIKSNFLVAIILAAVIIFAKPWLFKKSFILNREKEDFSKEVGIRLGQLSEFSLLVALLAFELGHISAKASQFIQLVTILTFIASSYIVVWKYPTPIGTENKLMKD
jgi:Kef-type K+ transport system membrane component KefB